jgi:hypothetical protein
MLHLRAEANDVCFVHDFEGGFTMDELRGTAMQHAAKREDLDQGRLSDSPGGIQPITPVAVTLAAVLSNLDCLRPSSKGVNGASEARSLGWCWPISTPSEDSGKLCQHMDSLDPTSND